MVMVMMSLAFEGLYQRLCMIKCDKFLNYAIALECLLIERGDRGGKTRKISERAAYILWGAPIKDKDIAILERLYDIAAKLFMKGTKKLDQKFPSTQEFSCEG